MTPRSCIGLLAALSLVFNFAISSAQACDVVSTMVRPALIFTVPTPTVTPPKITVSPMPRSMPLKMKIKSRPLRTAPAQAPVAVKRAGDYKPYMKDLEKSIRAAWQRPSTRRVMPGGPTIKMLGSGQPQNIEVKLTSGNEAVDRAAVRALYLVQAKPLPAGALQYVNVEFVFENSNGSSCCCGGEQCTCANAGACGGSQRI